MFPLLGGLLSGGMSLLGGMFQQNSQQQLLQQQQQFSAAQAQQAEQFSSEQAQKQMDFQERMSDTSYQRGVADMKAAGINPILAAGAGGASSPSGASGSGFMGSTPASFQPQNILGNAVSSAQAGARLTQELDNMSKTNDNIRATTENTDADTILKGYQKDQTRSLTANTQAETALKNQTFGIMGATLAKAKIDESVLDQPQFKAAYSIARELGMLGNEANSATSALGNFSGPLKAATDVLRMKLQHGIP